MLHVLKHIFLDLKANVFYIITIRTWLMTLNIFFLT